MDYRSVAAARFALAVYVASVLCGILHPILHLDHCEHACHEHEGEHGLVIESRCDDSCADPNHHHHHNEHNCADHTCPLCKTQSLAKLPPLGTCTVIVLVESRCAIATVPRAPLLERTACALFARAPPHASFLQLV